MTAIEWLDEQLQIMDSKSFNNIIQIEMGRDNYKEIFEEAKEMEKERIIEFAEYIRIKDFQTTERDNWIGLDMKYYTTEELFDQFKQQKQ